MQRNKKSTRELIYGINSCQAALENTPERVIGAYVQKGREDDKRLLTIMQLLNAYGVKMQLASRNFLDEKALDGVHQGVILEIKSEPLKGEKELEAFLENKEKPFVLILDGVTDPRNLGACMRSAWAAGADCVIVPKDKSATFSPAARKTASGAADVLPLFCVTNLARVLTYLKEEKFVTLIGMDGSGDKSIYELDLKGAIGIVMGSEESGMRRLTKEKCDIISKIPMAQGVESLNVSVAAGITLFECVRQKM